MKNTHAAILILSISLAACGRWGPHYQPTLTAQPANGAKYEADRKACIAKANVRQDRAASDYQNSNRRHLGGFGLLGGAVDAATADPEKDFNKTPMQMADECLLAKGYKLAK